jgi:hypothetical protein
MFDLLMLRYYNQDEIHIRFRGLFSPGGYTSFSRFALGRLERDCATVWRNGYQAWGHPYAGNPNA